MYRVIDAKWERLIGVYYTPAQARHGWGVYEVQGCVGCGFDLNARDERVIDYLRSLHENKIDIALRAGLQGAVRSGTTRDREIDEAIDRLSTGI